MSPKKITRLALIVGGISLLTLLVMAVTGSFTWWPIASLALALLLLVISFLRGAYLTAQQRVNMVDMLNDCYHGNSEAGVGSKAYEVGGRKLRAIFTPYSRLPTPYHGQGNFFKYSETAFISKPNCIFSLQCHS